MNLAVTLVSAQSPKSAPVIPAPPTVVVIEKATNEPVVEGRWHHVCRPQVVFWLTDAHGEVHDTYSARFGANFWVFAQGADGEEYEGYSFACDAGGHVGLIATNALAPGWRPNALRRIVEQAPPTVPAQEYASAS